MISVDIHQCKLRGTTQSGDCCKKLVGGILTRSMDRTSGPRDGRISTYVHNCRSAAGPLRLEIKDAKQLTAMLYAGVVQW
jgi:hypothetical protein